MICLICNFSTCFPNDSQYSIAVIVIAYHALRTFLNVMLSLWHILHYASVLSAIQQYKDHRISWNIVFCCSQAAKKISLLSVWSLFIDVKNLWQIYSYRIVPAIFFVHRHNTLCVIDVIDDSCIESTVLLSLSVHDILPLQVIAVRNIDIQYKAFVMSSCRT